MKPFDVSKFRKTITKSIDGISVGFHDPKTWISTGSYALNYVISGDFNRGIPLGKVSILAGESGCLPSTAKVAIKYDNHQQETTVGELKSLYNSGLYEIQVDTPDGYQPIVNWFDKGVLEMRRIKTSNHQTDCAFNHLLQTSSFDWVLAKDVRVGDLLITDLGTEEVIEVYSIDSEECYDFEVGHENHRYWGDGFSSHNSGKSLISANVIRNAQQQGIYVILVDSENALDEDWLKAFDVDTSDKALLKFNMAMVDDVAKMISEFVKEYRTIPESERPEILFVIDSLGMLMVPAQQEQFSSGTLKGDMGIKPKALKALITNCVNMFGNLGIGLLATNHTYSSQSQYQPDDIISGGSGPIFAASIVVSIKKGKLKEDEDGNKMKDVSGIRSMCQIAKTRYSKPFEKIELRIPYSGGLEKYSGLLDLFDGAGLLVKEGNSLVYTRSNGERLKYFRKAWNRNTNGCLDIVMEDVQSMVGGMFKSNATLDLNDLDSNDELM